MITLRLSASIAKPPEHRTPQNGNPDATATWRTQESEEALFASVTVFGNRCPVLPGRVKDDSILGSALARRTPTREGTAIPESAYRSPHPR